MENIKKSTKYLLIICTALIFIITIITIYLHYHPTHYKYNDFFVIGSTSEEIEFKYGEFDCQNLSDKNAYNHWAAYLVKKGRVDFQDKYYMIFFDEYGVAYKVEVREMFGR